MLIRTPYPRRAAIAGVVGLSLVLRSPPAAAATTPPPRPPGRRGNVTLSFLVDNAEPRAAEALVEAFEAEHPDITVELENRPQGTEGDNVVKTRLPTGDMTDLFWYNSGSLLQALNPDSDARRPERRGRGSAVDRHLHTSCRPERRGLRRAGGHRHGRRRPLQQGGLRGARARGPDDLGRVHGQQREDQGRRHRAGHPDLRRRPGRRSCSCSATSTTCSPTTRTGPRSSRPTRPIRRHPGRSAGFEHLQQVSEAGFFNEDFAVRDLRDGAQKLADGRGRALPDADLRGHRDRRRTTRTTSRTSASSPSPATTRRQPG